MRLTLSQPLRTPVARPRHALAQIVVGFFVLISLLSGCNQVETDRSAKATSAVGPRGVVDVFRWPEDPAHPVLELQIDTQKHSGVVRIELMPELAPATVNRIIELADQGYYDGTTFHRVIPGFMIQGGDPNSRDRDPTNDGFGDSTIKLQDEFGDAPFERGVVGMGNSGGPNSTSAQFFIMHKEQASLVGRYTAVGRVLSGIDLVDTITQMPIDRSGRWGPIDRPIENVVMTRVRTIGPLASLTEKADSPAASDPAAQEKSAPQRTNSGSDEVQSPASPSPSTDWERLEAGGR